MIALDVLRERLNISSDDHTEDELIEQLELAAVEMVQNYTNYTYAAEGSVVEYVAGLGTRDLFLLGTPTADPTEVLELPNAGDAGEVITAAADDGWERRGSKLVRKAGGVWTYGYDYKVTYAGGYAADSEPAAVREAVMQLVGYLYNNLGKEGMKSGTAGDNFSYAREQEPVKAILSTLPYRPVIA